MSLIIIPLLNVAIATLLFFAAMIAYRSDQWSWMLTHLFLAVINTAVAGANLYKLMH